MRHVEGEVRELIGRSGLDPARHSVEVEGLVRDAVSDYDERSVHGGMPTLASTNDTVKWILEVVAGYGPLQRYFDDPAIEEIWLNGPKSHFRTSRWFTWARRLRWVNPRALSPTHRALSRPSPEGRRTGDCASGPQLNQHSSGPHSPRPG